jgi:hypothetical protein
MLKSPVRVDIKFLTATVNAQLGKKYASTYISRVHNYRAGSRLLKRIVDDTWFDIVKNELKKAGKL